MKPLADRVELLEAIQQLKSHSTLLNSADDTVLKYNPTSLLLTQKQALDLIVNPGFKKTHLEQVLLDLRSRVALSTTNLPSNTQQQDTIQKDYRMS